jgi:glycosyltransferase involved in cell wall biosynthesis
MSPSSGLRVLHVVEATTAGVGRHVLDLSAIMRRLGVDVTVACPAVRQDARQDTAFVDRLQQAGVPVAIVPMRRSIDPLADLRAYHRLASEIGRGGYGVVHTHSSKAGVLGRLAARRAGVPAIVHTPHAYAFLGAANRLAFWSYRAVERWLGHHASHAVICVSASERALAQSECIAPPQRLVLIENAIDRSPFVPPQNGAATKEALGLDPARPVVGFVGRLATQKGLEYLVEAARLVADQSREACFVLVGEGELEGRLRCLIANYRLQDRVLLAGYRPDIGQAMAALDIFVLPSLYEGLAYTLLEAMAAGRAVIASDVIGNRDLIRPGETGVLVPPRDARALAGAIAHLLSSPGERARLGQNARDAALARPTPEQMTRQVIALYERLLANAHPR